MKCKLIQFQYQVNLVRCRKLQSKKASLNSIQYQETLLIIIAGAPAVHCRSWLNSIQYQVNLLIGAGAPKVHCLNSIQYQVNL